MKLKLIALAAAASVALILTACSTTTNSGGDAPIGGDIVAPVTMGVNQLQGAEVELVVGQALNIDTESLAVDSYTAEISDAKVLEFTQGGTSGGAEFNPGLLALAEGSSEVTLINDQGGIQPLEFTVTVVAR
jgi:hypothetical protein